MKKSGAQRDQMARAVVVLALITLTATRAYGTWFRRASACESYPPANAVFLGQVTSSETLSDGSTRTRFDVKEAFKSVRQQKQSRFPSARRCLTWVQYIFGVGRNT